MAGDMIGSIRPDGTRVGVVSRLPVDCVGCSRQFFAVYGAVFNLDCPFCKTFNRLSYEMNETKSATNPNDKDELERRMKDRDQTKDAPFKKPGGAHVTK